MVFIKMLQTKTVINASCAMQNDLFSLNFFSNQIQCSHVFLIIQCPKSSNLKQSLQTKREISVHTSPPRKCSECTARFLIRSGCSNPHLKIRPIAIFAFYSLNYSLAARLQDNSRPNSPTKVERKRKLQQFTVSGWLIINGGAIDSEKRKL